MLFFNRNVIKPGSEYRLANFPSEHIRKVCRQERIKYIIILCFVYASVCVHIYLSNKHN